MDSTFTTEPSANVNDHLEEFWNAADINETLLQYKSDQKLSFLRDSSMEALRKVLIEYRYFTIQYISDLALLVHRLPFGKLRSLMGEVLAEELGSGTAEYSHNYLYDEFLRSIGIDDAMLARPPEILSFGVLERISQKMKDVSIPYAVGLRGMGGECLCQVYLTALHWNMSQNKYIQDNKERIDWRFWEIHTGDHDIEHREKTRATINELALMKPHWVSDLKSGYLDSKRAWDDYWTHIYRSATELS